MTTGPARDAGDAGKDAGAGDVRAPLEVGEAAAGVFFTPPAGWEAAMRRGRFVLDSPSEPGAMLVLRSSVGSLDAARALLAEGWVEPGAALAPDGALLQLAPDVLLAPLAGTVSGQPAHATLLCRLSPHGGAVVVLGLTTEASARATLVGHVRAVGASLRFPPPDTAALLAPWDRHLRGRKLVFLAGSPGRAAGSGGERARDGWSEKKEIALAADGSFIATSTFRGSTASASAADVPLASASAADAPPARASPADVSPAEASSADPRTAPRRARGEWSLLALDGRPVLELRVAGEEPARLALSSHEGELLLDGERWYTADE